MALDHPIINRTQSDIDNRTSKGFFNIFDWMRVDLNSDSIADLLALSGYGNPNLNVMTPPTSITIPTAIEIDNLIENIELLRQVAFLPVSLGFVELKYDYKGGGGENTPNFEDINDWERNQEILYNAIRGAVNYRIKSGISNAGQSRFWQYRFDRPVPLMVHTTSPFFYTDFHATWVFNDTSVMTIDWGDGSPLESHATTLTHIYASSAIRLVKFYCRDWSAVTTLTMDNCDLVGLFPSLSQLTHLNTLYIQGNYYLLGAFPEVNVNMQVYCPYNAKFSGTLPDFSIPTWLNYIVSMETLATKYVPGSLAAQKYLYYVLLNTNALPQESIDNILADLVTSLSIPGRVGCNVGLDGGTNATPSAAGLANKAILIAAGWAVTTN